MNDIILQCPENAGNISKDARDTNSTGSFGAVTCATNGYTVLVEK